jgi:hypothetical protein
MGKHNKYSVDEQESECRSGENPSEIKNGLEPFAFMVLFGVAVGTLYTGYAMLTSGGS